MTFEENIIMEILDGCLFVSLDYSRLLVIQYPIFQSKHMFINKKCDYACTSLIIYRVTELFFSIYVADNEGSPSLLLNLPCLYPNPYP